MASLSSAQNRNRIKHTYVNLHYYHHHLSMTVFLLNRGYLVLPQSSLETSGDKWHSFFTGQMTFRSLNGSPFRSETLKKTTKRQVYPKLFILHIMLLTIQLNCVF